MSAQLAEALGHRLVSVVLYGGLAKGEYIPDTSDVNVMIVLDDVPVSALDRAAPIIQGSARDFRLAAMMVGESDLRRSTQVFPIEFLDMQRYHRVLWGEDVFTGLTISRDHMRLRCAQEITNLLLHQFFVQRAHRPELIETTLTRAVGSRNTDIAQILKMRCGPPLASDCVSGGGHPGKSVNCRESCIGVSSQVRPSNCLPLFFLFVPPHCLKKKGTCAAWH